MLHFRLLLCHCHWHVSEPRCVLRRFQLLAHRPFALLVSECCGAELDGAASEPVIERVYRLHESVAARPSVIQIEFMLVQIGRAQLQQVNPGLCKVEPLPVDGAQAVTTPQTSTVCGSGGVTR